MWPRRKADLVELVFFCCVEHCILKLNLLYFAVYILLSVFAFLILLPCEKMISKQNSLHVCH